MSGNVFKLDDDGLESLVDRVFLKWCSEGSGQSNLIPILQDIQAEKGYLPHDALEMVSNRLRLPPSHVYGVATFYHQFRMRPEGKHVVTICQGTACHVTGAMDINRFLFRHLKIDPSDDTSPDGLFTVKQVRCIGACSLSPVIKIDDEVYGKLDPRKLQKILARYRKGVAEDDR